METSSKKNAPGSTSNYFTAKMSTKGIVTSLLLIIALFAGSPVYAHCDSYDGPTVKDAIKALETNNVSLVLKWIDEKQEPEIITLFNKTYSLRNGDKEIYAIVEKYFLETLVRLHRETEGASYTGLKPAGHTKPIVQMSDHAIEAGSVDNLVVKLNGHMEEVVREKYKKVNELGKVKDTSPEKGRTYVKAYVDYTHTLEAIHGLLEHGEAANSVHKH